MMKKIFFALVALIGLICNQAQSQQCDTISTFPWEANFSSNFSCWPQSGNGYWTAANAQAVYGQLNSGVTSTGYITLTTPAIRLDCDSSGLCLWWKDQRNYFYPNLKVIVLKEDGTRDTIHTANMGDAGQGYVQHSVSLAAYVGQTVRIAFEVRLTAGGYSYRGTLSQIGIYSKHAPMGSLLAPELAIVGSSAVAILSLTRGLSPVSRIWHSTMLGDFVDIDTLPLLYTEAGWDTLTVTVSNAYGSMTVTSVIQVHDCGTVTTLPWSDDFQLAVNDGCWTKPYTTTTRRWRRASSSNNYYMQVLSAGTSSALYNEWLVSLPVELPDTVGLTLGWLYRSTRYSNRTPQMRVRLLVCDSTDDIDTAAAWVTLCEMDHYEQYFQQYYRLLDTWAGHRVRIAFQRVGAGGGNSDVDNVSIEIRTQPEILLAAPALVHGGDTVTVTPVMTSGMLSNPVYNWHSTMEERGLVDRLTDDDTLQFVYLSSGTDTITLTLTTDYGTATATAVVNVMDCRPVTQFPWHEGFEHNLDCWTMPINGISVWNLLTTGAHSGQGSVGARSTNVRYPYDTLVSQPIVVPTDAHGLTLMWWMKHNGGNASVRQMYVNALNAANPVWSATNTLFYCQGNDISTSWQQYTVDLEPLAGQTIRLAWAGGSDNGLYYVYMDDIEIRYTRELVGSLATSSAKVYKGDTVTATINLTEGDTAGITYLWTSSMENNGLATILGNGPQVGIAYNGAGIDTIIVTVSNNYGTFTDTAYVHICPVMDDLPWVVDFSNDFPCWQVLDGTCEVTSNGYLSFTDWPTTTVASSPLYVPTDGNVVLEFDCAYSFFYGSYLVMVTTDMTTFDTIGNYPFVSGRHPSAHIPLTAYAGQHIRLVFMATGQFLQFYLFNMSVRYSFEPVVSLAVDGSWFPGTELAIEATLVEGDTNGITYSWTSTKAQNGEAILIQDSSAQAQLTCYTGGPDTVTVVATNSYGSDTAWCTVNIKPCDTVDALQWMEDFTNYFTCWWQPEGSQWTLPDNPYYTMAVAVNVWHPTDSWLVSRAITLPTLPTSNGDELMLCWDASTQLNDTHSYCVMVTTAADYRDLNNYDTLIAIDTVHPDITVGWSTMRVPLNAYAGQTIRLAFRYTTENHVSTGVPGLLIIDNVHIIDTTIPEVPDTIWRNVSVYMVNSISNDTPTESDGVSVTGTGVYADSTLVTLTAIYNNNLWFWYWVNSVGDTIRDNPYSFIITSDTVFTAIFGPRFVGIGNVDGLPNVAIHPNPTTGDAYISVGVPSVVTVTDLQGRTVIQPTQVDSTLRIAQGTLPKGIYFVSVGNSAGTTVKKLVIQ